MSNHLSELFGIIWQYLLQFTRRGKGSRIGLQHIGLKFVASFPQRTHQKLAFRKRSDLEHTNTHRTWILPRIPQFAVKSIGITRQILKRKPVKIEKKPLQTLCLQTQWQNNQYGLQPHSSTMLALQSRSSNHWSRFQIIQRTQSSRIRIKCGEDAVITRQNQDRVTTRKESIRVHPSFDLHNKGINSGKSERHPDTPRLKRWHRICSCSKMLRVPLHADLSMGLHWSHFLIVNSVHHQSIL